MQVFIPGGDSDFHNGNMYFIEQLLPSGSYWCPHLCPQQKQLLVGPLPRGHLGHFGCYTLTSFSFDAET